MARLVDGDGDGGVQLAKNIPDPGKTISIVSPGGTIPVTSLEKRPKYKVMVIAAMSGNGVLPARDFICPQCGQLRDSYSIPDDDNDSRVQWRGNCGPCNIIWSISYEEEDDTDNGRLGPDFFPGNVPKSPLVHR